MKKSGLYLLLLIASMTLMLGCGGSKQEHSQDLVVVEQTDSVFGSREENNYCKASFTIDVPINGPQVLVDSVMTLVNREVYQFCEFCVHLDEGVVTYRPEEVFTDNGKQLLKHYMEKYRPLIKDSLWNLFDRSLKMEAQTESYVTYGLEKFHCGATCGSEKYYYIFDKSDGHQIKEIISHDNIVRFFERHPDFSHVEADAWSGSPAWKFSPENAFEEYSYGLLEDHFSLIIFGQYNHFFSVDIPYDKIFSYLSPEAQALVEKENKN